MSLVACEVTFSKITAENAFIREFNEYNKSDL